jgi:hypothetical protein
VTDVPARAHRQRQVLDYLREEHHRGRPGVHAREVREALGHRDWAVLERLVHTGRIRINHAGLCLPAFGRPASLPARVTWIFDAPRARLRHPTDDHHVAV